MSRIASAKDIDLVVFYQSSCSVRKHHDDGFDCEISWDTPLLEGYSYRFLPSIGKNHILGYLKPFNYGLSRFLKSGRFDAIIIHGYNRPYHWAAVIRAKLLGIRVFIRDEATQVSKKRSPLKRMFKRIFFSMLDRLATGFLSIGTANAQYYMDNGISKDRIFLTPYAVDNDFFRYHAKKAAKRKLELRSQLGLAKGRPVILFVGKLQKHKGIFDLFDAFVQASKSITPPPILLYVGDGELKQPLLKRIESHENDSIRFLGFRNQKELPAFYDICDVLVLASYSETWGLVVNEAMNIGKAIIVSDHVGCSYDLVKMGENGFIFPIGDIIALSISIIKVLSDPSGCKRMGDRSLEIISNWSFDEGVSGIRQALGLSKGIMRHNNRQ